MHGRISKRTVDALTATDGKEDVLWDLEIKGFHVRARPSGTKTYAYFYRAGSGRTAEKRLYTIGKHGAPWTPDSARKEAKRLQGLVTAGSDPAGEKTSTKRAPTVADLGERFVTEHAETKRKAATAKQYRRLLDQFILPQLGRKKVESITRQDVMRLHGAMAATPYQANRVLALISTLFTFAERIGERPDGSNPARHVERYQEEARERLLSAEELACLGEDLAETDESPYVVALIKLLIFTGARLGEVQMLRWEAVDFDRAEARLSDHKTSRKAGNKTLHLPSPAVEVLRTVPRLHGNPYVICGEKPETYFVGVQRPWQRIRQAATVKAWRGGSHPEASALVQGLDATLGRTPTFEECQALAVQEGVNLPNSLSDLRIHDLRHAFASVAASAGIGLPIITWTFTLTDPLPPAPVGPVCGAKSSTPFDRHYSLPLHGVHSAGHTTMKSGPRFQWSPSYKRPTDRPFPASTPSAVTPGRGTRWSPRHFPIAPTICTICHCSRETRALASSWTTTRSRLTSISGKMASTPRSQVEHRTLLTPIQRSLPVEMSYFTWA